MKLSVLDELLEESFLPSLERASPPPKVRKQGRGIGKGNKRLSRRRKKEKARTTFIRPLGSVRRGTKRPFQNRRALRDSPLLRSVRHAGGIFRRRLNKKTSLFRERPFSCQPPTDYSSAKYLIVLTIWLV